MATVWFENDRLYAGFALCHGIIRDHDDGLCVEHQTKDSLAGVIHTDVLEAKIPWNNVASIRLRRKWFGLSNELVIQLASLKEVQDVPGLEHGRLVLPIARRDVPFAEDLVESASLYLRKAAKSPQA